MTTPGGKKPAAAQAGSGTNKPEGRRCGPATAETFGRFVRNLAKLEGGSAGKGRKTKERSR